MILGEIQQVQPVGDVKMPERLEFKYPTDSEHSVFMNLVQQVNNDVVVADKAIQNYILDGGISTHELMIALQEAKHSLQVAVEVRNKIVEAYDKVTRMSI